jgi:hypothetical protein
MHYTFDYGGGLDHVLMNRSGVISAMHFCISLAVPITMYIKVNRNASALVANATTSRITFAAIEMVARHDGVLCWLLLILLVILCGSGGN